MGYSPWGCKESDKTEQLTHTWALNIWRWRGPRHAVCNILKEFSFGPLVCSQALLNYDYFEHLGMTCRDQSQEWHRQSPSDRAQLSLSPAVLVNLWEGPAVPRGAVHAQGHRAPWQRVPCPREASRLQTVPPGSLQRQDQREHHHLPSPR